MAVSVDVADAAGVCWLPGAASVDDAADGSGTALTGSARWAASVGAAGITSKIEVDVLYGTLGVKPPGLNLSPLCACALVAKRAAAAASAKAAERVMRNIFATT
jgi:hypothetical protein